MASLLEAVVSLAVSGAVVALLSASMASAVRVEKACLELGDELFQQRQLEHLVDRAVLAAGEGPAFPPPVASVSSDTVAFASDHDGNGTVDATSSETTALEVRQSSGDARVRLRFGRQTMTVLEVEDTVASLVALDRRGASAAASTTSLVELSIARRDEASGAEPARRLLFSLPPPAP